METNEKSMSSLPALNEVELKEKTMEARPLNGLVLLVIALAFGALMTLVSYKQASGMQWMLYVVALQAGLFFYAFLIKQKIKLASFVLAVINLGIAFITALRSELYTVMLAVMANLLGLGLLLVSFLNGAWLFYRLREYLAEAARLFASLISGFFLLLFEPKASAKDNNAEPGANWKALRPILVGVLIALPVLAVFGSLFASADPIFAQRFEGFAALFRFGDLKEIIEPTLMTLGIAYLSFGGMAYALSRSAKRLPAEREKPLVRPFLGSTESLTVLALVNLLFLSFLLIQFRYFFAGEANINLDGYTYSSYARQGFFELLTTALFSGLLLWVLSAVTKTESPAKRKTFSFLITVLLLQVLVVLVAAYQRMQLYVQAYGLTQDRLLPQIFMVFVALILLAMLVMQWRNRFSYFALTLSLSLIGFAIVTAALNVDARIARYNLAEAKQTGNFDASFAVYRLSTDAVPALFEAYNDKTYPADLHETIGQVLACKASRDAKRLDPAGPWYSKNLSEWQAKALYDAQRLELAAYAFRYSASYEASGIEFAEGFVPCELSDIID